MRKVLIIVYTIDSLKSLILEPNGVVIVVMFYLWDHAVHKNAWVDYIAYDALYNLIHNTLSFLDCGVTCHTRCIRLVPDLCGLSMDRANQMLAEIHAAKKQSPLERDDTFSSKPDISDLETVDSLSVQASITEPSHLEKRLSACNLSPMDTTIIDNKDASLYEEEGPSTMEPARTRVSLDDFSLLRVIGRGSFGKVNRIMVVLCWYHAHMFAFFIGHPDTQSQRQSTICN